MSYFASIAKFQIFWNNLWYVFKIQPKCGKEVKPKCDEVVIKKKFGSKTMRKSQGLSAESQEMIESFREFTRQYGRELSIEPSSLSL